ncbi:MAG: flagellar basal body-associated FliL family protein [Pacificimonas sp.]
MTTDAINDEDYRTHSADLPRRMLSGRNIALTLLLAGLIAAAVFALREVGPDIAPAAGPQYVEVPDMMVNLSSSDGGSRYLKVRVMLEAPSASDARALEAHLPAVIDGFQGYLRELRPEDLSGSAGTFRVKENLLRRVNLAVHPARASDVLVQEMIQQ